MMMKAKYRGQGSGGSHAGHRATRGFYLLLITAVFVLAGCSGDEKSDAKDFDDIIPKLLEKAAGPKPEEAAIDLFNTTSPDARRYAIETFQRKKYGLSGVYLKVYRVLATDPDDMVRSQAVAACGKSRDQSVADVVIAGTRDKAPVVRIAATQALVDWPLPAARDTLLDRLRIDPAAQVRINCAKSLRYYSEQLVIRVLIDALDDQDPAVVHFTGNSLGYITQVKNMPRDSKAWLSWYQLKYGNATTQAK